MSCAFSRFPNAHQTRNCGCAFNVGALRKKANAHGCAFSFFLMAHQTRKCAPKPPISGGAA
jgi:hypothetical protein